MRKHKVKNKLVTEDKRLDADVDKLVADLQTALAEADRLMKELHAEEDHDRGAAGLPADGQPGEGN